MKQSTIIHTCLTGVALALIPVAMAAGASTARRCNTGTLLDVDSRTDLVLTTSTQRVEKKRKGDKTVYTGYSTPDTRKRTTHTLQVAINGLIYTTESSPMFGPFSYEPTDLIVGDPIEACVDGKSLRIIRPNGKQFKTRIVRTARDERGEASGRSASPTDLSNASPKPFDVTMQSELTSYISGFMRQAQVPGASVAIVQNGRIVYQEGFGVRHWGKADPVTPETLMMIGSTGKSMTTMMMATLVDERKIAWETPAAKIYPAFAVKDSALTPKITLRNTVCNCTGMQQHDLEMFFRREQWTAESVINSISKFELTGEFGKSFGYVNQMVGAGGYIAAWAGRDGSDDLYANYLAQMQKRVFDPIGMTSTTFSFERVQANSNHATPHGLTASYNYVPISVDQEKVLVPIAPAGVSWSNARDTARYLITQLNRGIGPSGARVVSAENLTETWKPQVEIQPGVHYSLGWVTGTYKGQPLISHGGGTLGFTSELAFMPDLGLGIVVLSNAQNAQAFVAGVRSRILDLFSGQPADRKYSAKLEETRKTFQSRAADARPFDEVAAAAHLGRYRNTSLGEVSLTASAGRLIIAFPGFTSELRPLDNESYLVWDPPLAGTVIRFSKNVAGNPTFVLDADGADIHEEHAFVRVSDHSRASVTAIDEYPASRVDNYTRLHNPARAEALVNGVREQSKDVVASDLILIMAGNHLEKAIVRSRQLSAMIADRWRECQKCLF